MMGTSIAALKSAVYALAGALATYALFVTILTIPAVQNQVIYLNSVKLTWGLDVNFPEQWGFLRGQVKPFRLKTSDGESLHAWHILPLGTYSEHEAALLAESAGLVEDITTTKGFELLRKDPDAKLVLYLHGAAGTLGSGFRPPSYRAISAMDPDKIHIVAIDYRGFGSSTGSPSEAGINLDAQALADWALNVAGIPAERIVLFGQSLGTAVAISLAQHFGTRPHPVHIRGMVLVAPFVDVQTLTATYRVAGMVPLLGPVARFPRLLTYLNSFIRDKWSSKDTLASFIRLHETSSNRIAGRWNYWIQIIHAQDDYDIPWTHSETLFWHAYNATVPSAIPFEELEDVKRESRVDLGAGGWTVERRTERGYIREDILQHGLHDRTMSYPVVSRAIYQAFTHEPIHP